MVAGDIAAAHAYRYVGASGAGQGTERARERSGPASGAHSPPDTHSRTHTHPHRRHHRDLREVSRECSSHARNRAVLMRARARYRSPPPSPAQPPRLADVEVHEVQRVQVHANSPLGMDGIGHDEEWGWEDANGTAHNRGRANESATRRGTGNRPTGGGYFTLTMPSLVEGTEEGGGGGVRKVNHTTGRIRIDAVATVDEECPRLPGSHTHPYSHDAAHAMDFMGALGHDHGGPRKHGPRPGHENEYNVHHQDEALLADYEQTCRPGARPGESIQAKVRGGMGRGLVSARRSRACFLRFTRFHSHPMPGNLTSRATDLVLIRSWRRCLMCTRSRSRRSTATGTGMLLGRPRRPLPRPRTVRRRHDGCSIKSRRGQGRGLTWPPCRRPPCRWHTPVPSPGRCGSRRHSPPTCIGTPRPRSRPRRGV